MNMYTTSHELDRIERLLLDLVKRVKLDGTNTYIEREKYAHVLKRFKELSASIYKQVELHVDTADRIDDLSRIITKIADLDFTEKADEGERKDHLDHIAMCLNLAQEHLQIKLSKLKAINAVFNCSSDLQIITDNSGNIVAANEVLESTFGLREVDIKGSRIKDFFGLQKLRDNFSIDFKVGSPTHEITESFCENEDAKYVLSISLNSFNTAENFHELNFKERKQQRYWIYKVMPVLRTRYDNVHNSNTRIEKLIAEFSDKMLSVLDKNLKKDQLLMEFEQVLHDKSELNFMESAMYNSLVELKKQV